MLGVHFETIKSFYLGQAWPNAKLFWRCCQYDKALDSKPVTLLQGGDCLNRSVKNPLSNTNCNSSMIRARCVNLSETYQYF